MIQKPYPHAPGDIVELLPGETISEAQRRIEGYKYDYSLGLNPRPSLALPTESDARKKLPIATGVIDYFPLAFAAIAELSRIGNDKHNPGMPLHWSRGKSDDHPDALMRHFLERGKVDVNGVRHSTQVAWRALAILQLELEKAEIASMEEQAWRLQQRSAGATASVGALQQWRAVGAGVFVRGWPDIPPGPPGVPDEAICLPCDVEPSGHGDGGL